MLKALAVVACLVNVVAANAWITAGHYQWSTGTLSDGTPYESFRFFVELTSWSPSYPDDWGAAGLDAELTGGTFYQDAGGANPPDPLLFPWFPDAECDSYYTSPGDYPNADYTGWLAGLASTDDTDTTLATEWYDTIDTGNGEFVIAQVTVLPADPAWSMTGVMLYTHMDSGQLYDYEFTIPEPGTLSLLVLAALAVPRRREA